MPWEFYLIVAATNYLQLQTHDIIEPAHDKTYNKICATSEDSDQPVYTHCLISLRWSHVLSTASGLSQEW